MSVNTRRLGRQQELMLHDMRRYYDNHLGANVRAFRASHRRVLESLHRRGLVTSTGKYSSLTDAGEREADRVLDEVEQYARALDAQFGAPFTFPTIRRSN